MVRYLFGELAEDDRVRLEEEYFADDRLFEELEATETDLIDAFLRGELSVDERARFEARFLSSPRRRERAEIARRLLNVGAATVPTPARMTRWRTAVGDWLRRRPLLLPALGATALLLAVAGTWWIWRSAPGPVAVERDAQRSVPAPPPEPAAGPVPSREAAPVRSAPATAPTGPIALVLLPGLTRAPEGGSTLVLPARGSIVRIRIEHEGDAHAAYRAAIRSDQGRVVWSESGLKPTAPGEKSVVIAVRAAALPPGDYSLTLSASTPGRSPEDVADYSFRVVRQ